MNSSGRVIPALAKQGIKAENILVVHDELELPFGTVKIKVGGSHKGHNGLRSIIGVCGPDFMRVRCGIGRPLDRDKVPDYVLQPFSEPEAAVDALIDQAVHIVLTLVIHSNLKYLISFNSWMLTKSYIHTLLLY